MQTGVVKHCGGIQNIECVDSFTYFLLLHYWDCLRINLLQEISTEASALVRLILATPLGLVAQLITVIPVSRGLIATLVRSIFLSCPGAGPFL